MIHSTKNWFGSGLVTVAALLASTAANAQLSEVIPYDGYLEFDGEGIDGAYAFRFRLYDAVTGGAELASEEYSDEATRSCSAASSCLVDVYRGAFRVFLGSYDSLSGTVTADRALWIEIDVRDNAGTWISLDGRQQVTVAPYAMWAIDADTLEVGGTMQVGGSLSATDAFARRIDTGALSTTNSLSVDTLDAQSTGTSLTSSGASFVNGRLIVDGNASIGGELILDDGTRRTVARHTAGNDVTLNPDSEFSGVTFRAPVEPDRAVFVDGEFRIGSGSYNFGDYDEPNSPLVDGTSPFVVHRFDTASGNLLSTGIQKDDYICWIGGFQILNTDISTATTTASVWSLYPTVYSGIVTDWYVSSDVRSENSVSEHTEVALMCVQAVLVRDDSTDWFTNGGFP